MLAGLTWLLLFQLIGETIVHEFGLPFPGPVLGMLLLMVALMVRRAPVPEPLRDAGHGILRHLALLFVPAGVGVMLYYKALVDNMLPVLVVLVASTIATIAATGLAIRWLRRGGPEAADPSDNAGEPQ